MTHGVKLNAAQVDRACGAVLGSAAGDALGAAYEFGCATVGSDGPQMLGGGLGNFAPGEWTDDTSMTYAVLEVAAVRHELLSVAALDEVAVGFRRWYDSHPPDIGNQTRAVLSQVGSRPTATELSSAAYALHQRTGHTAGNGSLMRTAAVALPHLQDVGAVTAAARAISELTHVDERASEACLLWSQAIRHAVLEGELDVRVGLGELEGDAAGWWLERIEEAEASAPGQFAQNGWVVGAFQAAWSAIVHTPVPDGGMPCGHLRDALATAIGIGHDTDTVAAIAGSLLGARWGASAVPGEWRRILHGYPGVGGERLVELAHLASVGGVDGDGWPGAPVVDYGQFPGAKAPVLVRHPFDEGVWLGNVAALESLPAEVTAVVSLCRVGRAQVPEGLVHIGFRLIDSAAPAANPNLEFVLTDAARTVKALRAEGHVVLVHCVAAESRTPAVGAAYALLLGHGIEGARMAVEAVPGQQMNAGFAAALGLVD